MSGCSRRHSYDCTLPSFLPLSLPCVLETPGILWSPSLHSTSAAREADCVSQGMGSRGQRHLHCYLFQSAVCVSLFARQLLASRVSRLHEKETHLRCSCLLALFACFGRSSAAAAACVSLCFMLWIPFSSFLSSSVPVVLSCTAAAVLGHRNAAAAAVAALVLSHSLSRERRQQQQQQEPTLARASHAASHAGKEAQDFPGAACDPHSLSLFLSRVSDRKLRLLLRQPFYPFLPSSVCLAIPSRELLREFTCSAPSESLTQ